MSVTQISSDTLLANIEHHFRVAAGPGAGKTYWLVRHIKNVLHISNRLAKSKKIACITYTNIAVETILSRLGNSAENVDISTIHSFLYKHIVKPYISFISDDYGLDVFKMDGHDDTIPSNYSFLNDWKVRTGQLRITEDDKILEAFRNIKWKFNETRELELKTDYPIRANGYPIKNNSYIVYKRMTWEKGLLHHDDVLFFSYQLLTKFPFISTVISAKFPYFFIDEFQDSNPIQVAILKLIGQKETIIGIIGDRAQSIFGFQGADPNEFHLFNLPSILDYQISNNRRSSNDIVCFLNLLRNDIIQNAIRNQTSRQPTVYVGQMNIALNRVQTVCGTEPVYTLSRQNIISNALKLAIGGIGLNGKLFEELKKNDSNIRRSNFIISCIKSIEYAREGKFKDSIKELEKAYKYKNDKLIIKKTSLNAIVSLLERYMSYKHGSLFEFAEIIRNHIDNDISRVTSGGVKIFYNSYSYQQLALCVNVPEDLSRHKTIHKSKGDEFDNVLLVLRDESDLSFITIPDIERNEEHRINYVAVSRARNNLFISVPTLNENNRFLLMSKVQIIDI